MQMPLKQISVTNRFCFMKHREPLLIAPVMLHFVLSWGCIVCSLKFHRKNKRILNSTPDVPLYESELIQMIKKEKTIPHLGQQLYRHYENLPMQYTEIFFSMKKMKISLEKV